MSESQERKFALYVYVILIITYLLSHSSYYKYGVSCSSAWWSHISYMFFHASLLHLLINIYSFNILIRTPSHLRFRIAYSFIIGILSTIIYLPPTSILVGFSGVVFALLGLVASEHYTAMNFSLIVISLIVSYFIPGVAFYIHLICFAIGFMTYKIHTYIKEFVYDNK